MTTSPVTTPTELHDAAVALLRDWAAPTTDQAALAQAYLAFLDSNPAATQRPNVPGHLTASALLLNADRTHTLLTLHPRVGQWLQLGGHCEPEDSSLEEAALREVREESGIDAVRLDRLLHLDVHPITCSLGVPTRHLDVRFLAVTTAPGLPAPQISSESDDLRWFPLAEAATFPAVASLVAAVGVGDE